MLGSNSNLSTVDGQHAAAKRKEYDVATAAQVAAATMHREQETLVIAVAITRKILNEARVRERTVALAWEKEKTIARHLEQQLAAAQGIVLPQDDDDDRSIDAAGLQNIQSVVTIVLEPSSPDYKRWCDLVLLTLHRYVLDNHVLSDVADPFIYWARLDNIIVTWILDTLSPSSTRSFGSRRRPHVRRGSRSRISCSATVSRVFYSSTPCSMPLSKETSALATTVTG
jgi:hypothetical protein